MNRSAELQFGQIRRAKDTLIAPGWSPALHSPGCGSQPKQFRNAHASQITDVFQLSQNGFGVENQGHANQHRNDSAD